jgi:subtilisin family serine protease
MGAILRDLRATVIGQWTLPNDRPEGAARIADQEPNPPFRYVIIDAKADFIPDNTAWDAAHAVLAQFQKTASMAADRFLLVEPDVLQTPAMPITIGADPSYNWPFPPDFAWHLKADYSQLTDASSAVNTGERAHLAILDTGIWPQHVSTPPASRLRLSKAWNFVERNNDVTDPMTGGLGNNPGHGTATLALLTGGWINAAYPKHGWKFDGNFGGAPFHPVIPYRIANSVVHFYSSAMAEGISTVAKVAVEEQQRDFVCSISMGGVAIQAWADAVNAAYEAGVTVVAAAGNNFNGAPTPYVVYPSRFNRVLTAAGATSLKEPYLQASFGVMQGCCGPPSIMRKAIAAYTPQIPWAKVGTVDTFDLNGQGTSCATPQVAAAAALWLEANGQKVAKGWPRVEAARHALFRAADFVQQYEFAFGRGLLRAHDALSVIDVGNPPSQPKDRVSYPFWRLLLGLDEPSTPAEAMFEVEATQLALMDPLLSGTLGSDDEAHTLVKASPPDVLLGLMNRLSNMPTTSNVLRDYMADKKGRIAREK